MPDGQTILEALSRVNDPELHRSLTDLNMVRDIQIKGGVVEVTIALTVPDCPLKAQIKKEVRAAIAALPGVKKVAVHLTVMSDQERKALTGEQKGGVASPYNHVKRVVAVVSGKGGVGKSLVTGLLATALAGEGFQVGILDAGPALYPGTRPVSPENA